MPKPRVNGVATPRTSPECGYRKQACVNVVSMLSVPSQAPAKLTNEEVQGTLRSTAVSAGPLGLRPVLLMTLACYFVYLLTIWRLTDYWEFVRAFGDNTPYVTITAAIEHWNFSQLHVKLFWGLPYAAAVVSSVTHLTNLKALVAISILASLAAMTLSYKLWGGWVTIAFIILSREWLERSLLGGAEPLFLALLFAAFLAARKEKWALAALLVSLSTVVRPMGVFGLAGLAVALLVRRDYRRLAVATAIGLAIGALYILPLKLYVGDSLANVKGYNHADWHSNSPVTFPFVAMVHDIHTGSATKLNLARTAVWILFILLSSLLMAKSGALREYARSQPVEAMFWGLYLVFLFTYNSSWARAEFPRFAIPLVPFSAFALEQWIPRNYRLLFVVGLLAAVLSAAETVGITNAIHLLRQAL